MLNRRAFLVSGAAAALAGCVTKEAVVAEAKAKPKYHVFSKMFQSPVCAGYDAVAELMAKAGFDGIEWTVRPKGHVLPETAARDLPRAVAAARRQGLASELMVTAVTDGSAASETLLRIAADNGVKMFRPGYFFYDLKKETFRQSMDRIRRGFAELARVAEKTGVRCAYQNHSSWGPSVFGGLVWDVWTVTRDLDPKWMTLEYDPMHAYFETNLSWSHGLDLVADRIGAVCLKDFHYQMSKKNPKDHAKFMCAAGEGIVPWKEVKQHLDAHGVRAPFTVHFEYDFDKTDLVKSVKSELDAFKRVFG